MAPPIALACIDALPLSAVGCDINTPGFSGPFGSLVADLGKSVTGSNILLGFYAHTHVISVSKVLIFSPPMSLLIAKELAGMTRHRGN